MAQQNGCLAITIQGVVQGVGFRPFIYNLARELGIRGFVSNTAEGVIIRAEGPELDRFIDRIRRDAPPLSRIEKVQIIPSEPCGLADFSIRQSEDGDSFTLLSPDISICEACLLELFSVGDRRYRYPFINCTNCGPRYSITRSIPYDRRNTTMKGFDLCDPCASEYRDPSDRRFHAQPNACPSCGPRVTLLDARGNRVDCADPVDHAVELLKRGKLLAVKGLGGFHIACNAMDREAVVTLRRRKRKSNKPFALMSPDISFIGECCTITSKEEELLSSPQRPVVLLRKKDLSILPDEVSPGNSYLGFMLPYTPLHYLLFFSRRISDMKALFPALVMTSGNLSEEPIIGTNADAVEKLAGTVDAFLVHDRDIFMRVDDSVVRTIARPGRHRGQTETAVSFIRRSRGYAPEPVPLLSDGPVVLGCGADVKNTFALTRGQYAIMSQHIGDMENYETLQFFEETLANLSQVYRAVPELIAYDLHPRYLSSSWALEYAQRNNVQLMGVQHHYAHIGSVMAEHGLRGNVIGVAFDGTGYGTDGTLWGGEFLIAHSKGFRRAGHLKYISLPGGETAVREPWRVAVSFLRDAFGPEDFLKHIAPTGLLERFGTKEIEDVLKIAGNPAFSPLSSGAGRLFDAVSAIIGACDYNSFEGEASMALESLAREDIDEEYPVDIHFGDDVEVDFSYGVLCMVEDLRRSTDRTTIASKFHNAVAGAIVRVVIKLSLMNNIRMVALSGGVFQNLHLTETVIRGLQAEGLAVYINEQVPCNDAGISLGQAYLARELKKGGALP
ncbi:MAG: carbamoyltransferase HypF [Nitrospirae bacterium]|nr:carbamoyltransferase HypF [Nitrospirota bacterium]